MDIKELEANMNKTNNPTHKFSTGEVEFKQKTSVSNYKTPLMMKNNIVPEDFNSINNHRKESNKAFFVSELENNFKADHLSNNDKETKSVVSSHKTNQLFEKENIDKPQYSSRSNRPDNTTTNRKILSSNKQSPERSGRLVDRLIEGYEKQKNLSERDSQNDLKVEEFSKSTLNQYTSKINQILQRNPSNDEKQFPVMGSNDLKKKLDTMRSEINDSLQRDKETSFNKKSESLTKSSINLNKTKQQSEKIKTQLQKQQLKNNSMDFSNINDKN
jgi:hypothetical protein